MKKENKEKLVIALGFFDGVHKGHSKLIEMAKLRAKELNLAPAVLSFDVSPRSIITGEKIPLIGNLKAREMVIHQHYGVEKVIIYHFDLKIMSLPWENFLISLMNKFNVAHLVIGHDFHCGYKGQGTPERISEFCKKNNLGCDIVPEFKIGGLTVSSTYIRELIFQGNMERANEFLGYEYFVYGKIKDGFKNGRKMGTPTINLSYEEGLVLPPFGVYATKTEIDDEIYCSITNVGIRPTFENSEKITIETFILDFDGDLYGKNAKINFLKFLRKERKFESANELSVQIQKDTLNAREFFK